MENIIFIKFGGSLITDKSKPNSVRLEIIKDLSRQIKTIISKDKNISLIIGNGAGSFGHFLVNKYQLQNRISNKDQNIRIAEVLNGVATLNRIVVSSLIKAGVPAVSISPSSMMKLNDKKLTGFFLDSLLGFLEIKMVPVIFGDMIFDEALGASVFSTEKQIVSLSQILKEKNIFIKKAVFCSITDGVLDKDGRTIKLITDKNYDKLKDIFFESKSIDVTGEMKQKVESCLKLGANGITSYIINGQKNNALINTVFEEKDEYTVIKSAD